MSTLIKFTRGTTSKVQAYTAEIGEPVYDIEKKRLYIGTDSTIEEIGGDTFSIEDDTLDIIEDGTTFGKVKNLDLTDNRVDFEKLFGITITKDQLNALGGGGIQITKYSGITISDTTGGADALTITHASGDGIQIDDVTGDGILINDSTGDAIHIINSQSYGIEIDTATLDAIRITDAGSNAIEIVDANSHAILVNNTSSGDGLHITNSADDGISIETAGNNAIEIDNATAHGILIDDAGGDGIHITTATDNAIQVSGAGTNAILIANATDDAIQINDAGADGIEIQDAGDNAIRITTATNDGILISAAGGYAIHIANSTSHGIYIEDAGGDGIHIDTATDDAIQITNAGTNAILIATATDDAIQINNAGVHAVNIQNASQDGVRVSDAGNYGIYVGNCEGGYGPLHIVASTGSGSSGLHTQYPSAAVDTLAVDSNNDLFIKTGASTWTRVGATAAASGVVNSSVITGTAITNNAVIIDANGLTMRKGAGAVRFDVNEDGSFTLGNSAGDRIAFTTGDILTVYNATLNTCTLTSCILDADSNTVSNLAHGSEVDNPSSGVHGAAGTIVGSSDILTLTNKTLTSPKINEDVVLSSTATELNQLDGVTVGGNSSGDIITTDDTQTLTNKTVSGYSLTSHNHSGVYAPLSHSQAFSTITSGNVSAGVLLGVTGNDSTPAEIRVGDLGGYYTKIMSNSAGSEMWISPSADNQTDLNISFDGGTDFYFKNIYAWAYDSIELKAGADGTLHIAGGTDSSGNNYADIDINPSDFGSISFRCRVNTDTEDFTMGPTQFRTQSNQVVDLGTNGQRWATVYCYDVDNIADYLYMDDMIENGEIIPIDDLAIIESIKPSNKIDKMTGCRLIDDDTIPGIILNKDKKTNNILRDSDRKPGFSLRIMQSLFMGAFRQLHKMIEDLENEVTILKESIK